MRFRVRHQKTWHADKSVVLPTILAIHQFIKRRKLVKAIRWLHAFNRGPTASLIDCAMWEISHAAERSVEPLWKGQSLISNERVHSHLIGLGIDTLDIYRQGFLVDCWSSLHKNGTRILKGWDREPAHTPNIFWRRWNARKPAHHGELITYRCRVPATCIVHTRDDTIGRAKAAALAAQLNLPVRNVRALDFQY
jgi:hypothetical protein